MNLNWISIDDQAFFCSKDPWSIKIESQEDIKLTPTILSRKLEELEQMDASTFFSWKDWNYIDNHWAHIWFIENYKNLINLIDSKNQILAGVAKDIILILHRIVSEKTSIDPATDGCTINPLKKAFDLWDKIKYLHGFLITNHESGSTEEIENIKLYTDFEVQDILQNN